VIFKIGFHFGHSIIVSFVTNQTIIFIIVLTIICVTLPTGISISVVFVTPKGVINKKIKN